MKLVTAAVDPPQHGVGHPHQPQRDRHHGAHDDVDERGHEQVGGDLLLHLPGDVHRALPVRQPRRGVDDLAQHAVAGGEQEVDEGQHDRGPAQERLHAAEDGGPDARLLDLDLGGRAGGGAGRELLHLLRGPGQLLDAAEDRLQLRLHAAQAVGRARHPGAGRPGEGVHAEADDQQQAEHHDRRARGLRQARALQPAHQGNEEEVQHHPDHQRQQELAGGAERVQAGEDEQARWCRRTRRCPALPRRARGGASRGARRGARSVSRRSEAHPDHRSARGGPGASFPGLFRAIMVDPHPAGDPT